MNFDDHLLFCVGIRMGNVKALLTLRNLNKSWCECVLQIIKFQIMTLYPSILANSEYTLTALWFTFRKVYGFGILIVCPNGTHQYTFRKQVGVSTSMVLGRRNFQRYTNNATDCKYVSRRHVKFSFENEFSSEGVGILNCFGLNGCVVHHDYRTTDIKYTILEDESYVLNFYDKIEISEGQQLYVKPIAPHKRFLINF